MILLFIKTFDEHLERLWQVLLRLRESGLKVTSKCHLFCESVPFLLGHIISKDGVATDPTKVTVSTWHAPTSKLDVRMQFLGTGVLLSATIL